MTVVLDAWAVLAYLRDEPAAERIAQITRDQRIVTSWINLGEVLYQEARRVGFADAEEAVRSVAKSLHAEPADVALVVAASRWKARGGLSYADAFAVATAHRHQAPLLTGDTELIALDGDGVTVTDVRHR